MEISDDILTYVTRHGPPVNRVNANAGRTRHRGVEVGLGVALDARAARGRQLLQRDPHVPRVVAERRRRLRGQADGEPRRATSSDRAAALRPALARRRAGSAPSGPRIGAYWMDAANSAPLPGHDLVDLRLNAPLAGGLELVTRMSNVSTPATPRAPPTARWARSSRPEGRARCTWASTTAGAGTDDGEIFTTSPGRDRGASALALVALGGCRLGEAAAPAEAIMLAAGGRGTPPSRWRQAGGGVRRLGRGRRGGARRVPRLACSRMGARPRRCG